MTPWLLAAAAGVLFAGLQYGRLVQREGARVLAPALLRAAAIALLVALLLDARAGRERLPDPIVALDASQSWTRGDSTRWPAAFRQARALAGDSLLLFGDSARMAGDRALPGDAASALGSVIERATAERRPVVVMTDGEAELPPEGLDALPRGSRVEVAVTSPGSDAAIAEIEAPSAAASGETIRVRVTVRAGGSPTPAGTLSVRLAERQIAVAQVPALPAWGATTVDARSRLQAPEGTHPLTAVLAVRGDVEPRNDSLSIALDVSPMPGAVWVSSAPDLDSRAALAVLRGTLRLPARGFLQVAPGTWRIEGSLEPVSESAVRAAVRDAPLLVLHGDTAVFGPPRALAGTAPLALLPGPDRDAPAQPAALDEWYPTGAPPSPAAAALAGVAWDSLAPVSLGAAGVPAVPAGGWVAIEGRRGRRGTAAPFIVGTESPRRVLVAYAKGMSRWQARGGAGAVAYSGLWGSLFDWLAAARRDRRGAVPHDAAVREGPPVRWRLADADSSVRVVLRRRGGTSRDTTLMLRAATGTTVATSPPMPRGIYDVESTGGRSLLVVNAASELVPRRPSLRSGSYGRAAVASTTPALRQLGIAYAAVILLLSLEWVLRRQQGLR